MPGLNQNLVVHKLKVDPNVKPVKQPPKKYHLDVEEKIKFELQKLLKAKFVEEIKCPSWLTNIVLVKKKNDQIRFFVDLRDVNKAYPKDEFPLPNVDILLDAKAGHECFFFMDGYSGYNKILMDPVDAPKTTFRTPFGNYFYRVMPFGLKNANATYQRTMTSIFGDVLHKQVQDYVDDLVVKVKNLVEHLMHLRQVFERCREHSLRMNPAKYAFGVSSGKFLGFLVHHRGIDLDPTKAKAITTLSPPTILKELRSFVGKVSYLWRFIPGLVKILKPFMEQTKKGVTFVWFDQCQKVSKKIQMILADPYTMVIPIPGKPMLLYITNTEQSWERY